MSQPVLFLVDDDPGVVQALNDDLSRRFGRDFCVLGTSCASDGLATLHSLAVREQPVALLIVSHAMREMPGVDFSPGHTNCIRWPNGCSWWTAITRRGARSCRP